MEYIRGCNPIHIPKGCDELNRNTRRAQKRAAKNVLAGVLMTSLLLPAGLASASAVVVSEAPAAFSTAEGEHTVAQEADPSKVKVTKEEAIAKLKELLPVLKKATASSVSLGVTNVYPPPSNQMVWQIGWNYSEGNSSYGFSSQVDAINGDIINVSFHGPVLDDAVYYPPKLTRAQAQEKAKEWIVKAAPSLAGAELRQSNDYIFPESGTLFGPAQYSYGYQVVRNGIVSPVEHVSVTVNGNGELVRFSKSSERYVYPDAKPALSEEEALKQLTSDFGVRLTYQPITGRTGVPSKWVLAWIPEEIATTPIDAVTGKRLSIMGSGEAVPVKYDSLPASANAFKPRAGSGEMTLKEAAALIEAAKVLPASAKEVNGSIGADFRDPSRNVWNVYWTDSENGYAMGFPDRTRAEIDAVTGEVFSISADMYGPKAEPAGDKIGEAQAQAKANEIVSRFFPDAASELRLVNRGSGNHDSWRGTEGYQFTYVRFQNDILVGGSTINVQLDAKGNLQYYYNFSSAPDAGEAVSPANLAVTEEEAFKGYLDRYDLELQYYASPISRLTNADPQELKLVYQATAAGDGSPYEQTILDASTGEWIRPYELDLAVRGEASQATDIEGHWAEEALATLLSYGVVQPDEDGLLLPDAKLKAGEWLEWMSKALGTYNISYYSSQGAAPAAGVALDNPYYEQVRVALERGWIDGEAVFNPEAELTREQLAALAVAAVNYKKLSAFLTEDVQVTGLADAASIQNKGAVALAVKLGLMQDADGRFNPEGAVTRAQAATVMLRLATLQGRTDQQIGGNNR